MMKFINHSTIQDTSNSFQINRLLTSTILVLRTFLVNYNVGQGHRQKIEKAHSCQESQGDVTYWPSVLLLYDAKNYFSII